jgi:hypothetical protein
MWQSPCVCVCVCVSWRGASGKRYTQPLFLVFYCNDYTYTCTLKLNEFVIVVTTDTQKANFINHPSPDPSLNMYGKLTISPPTMDSHDTVLLIKISTIAVEVPNMYLSTVFLLQGLIKSMSPISFQGKRLRHYVHKWYSLLSIIN